MTNKEMYEKAQKNGIDDICRFMRNMKKAGLKIEDYRGRFFWTGPAVRVNDLQDALSATKVKCQWDNMGLGYIVYPKTPLSIANMIFGDFKE